MAHNPLSRDEEVKQLISMYESAGKAGLMESLERQFTVLHNRAQVMLGLTGIVITTTGFSGRMIAGTNRLAQALIIAGVTISLIAAAVVAAGVLHLWWLSQHPGQSTEQWLHSCLAYRDRKTRFYRIGLMMLLVGLAAYVAAIAVMLLHPDAHAVPMLR